MAYDWPDGPLPALTDELRLSTPAHFDHLKPDSFKDLAESSLEVRDTDMAKITGGMVGVKLFRAKPGAVQRGIPWHYHELGVHVSYVIKGWAVYEFEGVGVTRIEAGSLLYQAPFNRHRELEQSEDFEVMEITLPGKFESIIMQYDEDAKDWDYTRMII